MVLFSKENIEKLNVLLLIVFFSIAISVYTFFYIFSINKFLYYILILSVGFYIVINLRIQLLLDNLSLLLFPAIFLLNFALTSDFIYIKFCIEILFCTFFFVILSIKDRNAEINNYLNKNKIKILYILSIFSIFFYFYSSIITYYNGFPIPNFPLVEYFYLKKSYYNIFENNFTLSFLLILIIKLFIFQKIKEKKNISVIFYFSLIVDLVYLFSISYYTLYFTIVMFVVLNQIFLKFSLIKTKIFFTISFILFSIFIFLFWAKTDQILQLIDKDYANAIKKYYQCRYDICQNFPRWDINKITAQVLGNKVVPIINGLFDRFYLYWSPSEWNNYATQNISLFTFKSYNLSIVHSFYVELIINFGILSFALIFHLINILKKIKSKISLVLFFNIVLLSLFDHIMFYRHFYISIIFWFLIGLTNIKHDKKSLKN